MKTVVLFFGILLSAFSAYASQCNGAIEFSGVFADITCRYGICSGYIPAQPIQSKGTCSNEIDFVSKGNYVATFVKGTCIDGAVSLSANSQRISLFGDCLKYDEVVGLYSSIVYSPDYSGSGYCQPNGMTRIFFNGAVRPFSGECRN